MEVGGISCRTRNECAESWGDNSDQGEKNEIKNATNGEQEMAEEPRSGCLVALVGHRGDD